MNRTKCHGTLIRDSLGCWSHIKGPRYITVHTHTHTYISYIYLSLLRLIGSDDSLEWLHISIKVSSITGYSTVCWPPYSGYKGRRKHSIPSLFVFLCEIHHWSHTGPVKQAENVSIPWRHHAVNGSTQKKYNNNIAHYTGVYLLWPSGVIWRQIFRPIVVQVMACCMMAPNHYMNPCLLIIGKILWHSFQWQFHGEC